MLGYYLKDPRARDIGHEQCERLANSPAVPLHVEYALTDLGRDATVPLAALRTWVEQNIDRFPARA